MTRELEAVTHTITTLEEMEREAEVFIAALPSEEKGATLVTLSGELGAGKTTFTQYVAKALGVGDTVNSPTFVIEKIYEIPEDKRFSRLVHIDDYRLQGASDLNVLGFGEVMSHKGTLILLEWPEQVMGIAEQASVRIVLELLSDGARQITYA